MKNLPEPLDVNLSYEEVCVSCGHTSRRLRWLRTALLIEHLAEFKALDDEGRRAAFSKFVNEQKVCL